MPNPIIGQDKPTPIYDLFEKYPEVPRSIILKCDLLNVGVKFTPVLTWIGKWTYSFGSLGGYETKPKELYEGKIGQGEGPYGYYDLPAFMLFRDGTFTQVLIKGESPYEIRYEGDGSYMIYWNGMAVEEVLFPRRPAWMSRSLADGKPLGELFNALSDGCT